MSPRPGGGGGGRPRPGAGGGSGGRSGGPGGRGGSGGRSGGPGGPGGRGGGSGGRSGGFGGRSGGSGGQGGRPGGSGGQGGRGGDGDFGPGPRGGRGDRDRDFRSGGRDRGYGRGDRDQNYERGPGPVGGRGNQRGYESAAPRGGRSDRPERGGRSRTNGDAPPTATDGIVYGRNPVRELIRAKRRVIDLVHVTDQVATAPWLEGVPKRITNSDYIAEIAGTNDHQGIVAECSGYPYVDLAELVGKPGVIIVLDEITDPRNVGAIARTAEATGAIGLVIPERRAAHVTATVSKTSAGAIEHLSVAIVTNVADAVATLKAGGAWTYGAAMGGTDVGQLDLTGSVAFVLGGEGKGLRPRVADACDALVSLPMVGKVDSLNVSAAAAVLMYSAFSAQR